MYCSSLLCLLFKLLEYFVTVFFLIFFFLERNLEFMCQRNSLVAHRAFLLLFFENILFIVFTTWENLSIYFTWFYGVVRIGTWKEGRLANKKVIFISLQGGSGRRTPSGMCLVGMFLFPQKFQEFVFSFSWMECCQKDVHYRFLEVNAVWAWSLKLLFFFIQHFRRF